MCANNPNAFYGEFYTSNLIWSSWPYRFNIMQINDNSEHNWWHGATKFNLSKNNQFAQIIRPIARLSKIITMFSFSISLWLCFYKLVLLLLHLTYLILLNDRSNLNLLLSYFIRSLSSTDCLIMKILQCVLIWMYAYDNPNINY